MIYYKVYLIRQKIDDKVLYVGCTHAIARRRKEHFSLTSNTAYWLSKIGVENVYLEQIERFNNREDALRYEDEMILKYNTIKEGFNKNRSGYNREKEESNFVSKKREIEIDKYRQRLLRVLEKLDNSESIIKQYQDQGFDPYGNTDDIRERYKRLFVC